MQAAEKVCVGKKQRFGRFAAFLEADLLAGIEALRLPNLLIRPKVIRPIIEREGLK